MIRRRGACVDPLHGFTRSSTAAGDRDHADRPTLLLVSRQPVHRVLLIYRDSNVLAYAFDEARAEIVGDPITIGQQVGSFVASGFYSTSLTGVLVYRSTAAAQNARLQWWTREGAYSNNPEQPGGIRAMALSPDGAAGPGPSGHRQPDWRRVDVGHDGRQRHARDVRHAARRVSGVDA